MRLNTVRFLSLFLTAISLGAGLAHLFALPNKIDLPAQDYLTLQHTYQGWALLGVVLFGALASTVTLAIMVRRKSRIFRLTATAAACIAATLIVFFTFTYPANQKTKNWKILPADWQELRAKWEYSHATNAGLYTVALVMLILSVLKTEDKSRRE